MIDLLGWGEFFFVFVVALIVIGPKELPKVLYTVGRWMAAATRHWEHVKEEYHNLSRLGHVQTLQEQQKDLNAPLSSQRKE